MAIPPINTVDGLRAHLQTALELEHATIPPYFAAWLSANEDANRETVQIIRSVMLEEMLHLTLVANLLTAIGGRPNLTHRNFVVQYPHRLPHSGAKFEVSIERFSPAALQTFLQIEQPEPEGAKAEPGKYHTIGQFYGAIAEAFKCLSETIGEKELFTGALSDQVRPEDYYGSGRLVVVKDLKSALAAIAEIKEQGEGKNETVFGTDPVIIGDGDGKEPAHYFRFKEIEFGKRYIPRDTVASGPNGRPITTKYEAVYPMESNIQLSDYAPGSEVRAALETFCDLYHNLLVCLERSFTGSRAELTQSMALMFALKNQALSIIRTPSPRGNDNTVGLVFTRT